MNDVHTYSKNKEWLFAKPRSVIFKSKYGWIYGKISCAHYTESIDGPYVTLINCFCQKDKIMGNPINWFLGDLSTWKPYFYETIEELTYNHFIDLL